MSMEATKLVDGRAKEILSMLPEDDRQTIVAHVEGVRAAAWRDGRSDARASEVMGVAAVIGVLLLAAWIGGNLTVGARVATITAERDACAARIRHVEAQATKLTERCIDAVLCECREEGK